MKRLFDSMINPFPLLIAALVFLPAAGKATAGDHERLFTDIEGWEKPSEIDVYVPDNLWDIINGAADVFMAYDFRELYWGEYINSTESDVYIVVEIYRQGDPVNAFGVYSQERPGVPQLVDVGVQGYSVPGALNFFVADCYVKIRSHDRSDETATAMKKLASHISSTLDSSPAFPEIISMLPQEGKVRFSDQFINTNFLGHPFLSRAFVSTYEIDGEKFNLFLIENSSREESEKILADYYKFSRQEKTGLTEGIHRIDDRWNGHVGIVWKDNRLYGFYNLDDAELQEKYLSLFLSH